MLFSETFSLEDCIRMDDATTDKSNNYTKTSNLTITHDIDHYVFSNSSQNQFLTVGEDYDNVQFEIDAKLIQPTTYGNNGIGIMDRATSLYNTALMTIELNRTQFLTFSNANYNASQTQTVQKSNNTYYKYIIIVNGDTVTGKVYDGDTELYNKSITKSLSKKYYNIGLTSNNTMLHVRNIKIKRL